MTKPSITIELTQLIIFCLVLLAVLTRVLPHAPNFTAIGALALFCGSRMGLKGMWVPLLAMLISDLLLGFHSLILYVYAGFAVMFLLGWLNLNKPTLWNIAPNAIAGSLLFYLITNFGVWLHSGMYQKSIEGLILCYTMALPFLRNSMSADLVYTYGLFGALALALQLVPRKTTNSLLKS